MQNTMAALVKEKCGTGLTLKQVPIPVTGPNDVKIKIHFTSICGTDLHIYNWDTWSQNTLHPPVITGHEYVGEITELGQNVTGFALGDIVSGEGHIVCGVCRNCKAGKRHLCRYTQGVGVNRDGAFAEYLVIPAANTVQCMPGIPEPLCACFDPLGNAVHTALAFDLIGEDVLITGAGPIGIMAAAVSCHVGARHVVITDVNEYRLRLARTLCGARTVNVTSESLQDAMRELGIHEGFDVGMEMSGNAAALNTMIDNMYNGGRIAMLGIQSGPTAVDWNKVVFKCLNIRGIYGREMYETWYKMMSMLTSGLSIEHIITHQFDYTKFEEGFAVMQSGHCGKVILDWRGAGI